MYKLKEVSRGNYDDRGYSNEESMAHLMLQRPEEIKNKQNKEHFLDYVSANLAF